MRLSVDTQNRSIRINNCNRIVLGLIVLLEEGYGKNHTQFLCNLLKVSNQSARGSGFRKSERLLLLILAEIPPREKLLKQNDLGTLCSSLTNQLLSLSDILFPYRADVKSDG